MPEGFYVTLPCNICPDYSGTGHTCRNHANSRNECDKAFCPSPMSDTLTELLRLNKTLSLFVEIYLKAHSDVLNPTILREFIERL